MEGRAGLGGGLERRQGVGAGGWRGAGKHASVFFLSLLPREARFLELKPSCSVGEAFS